MRNLLGIAILSFFTMMAACGSSTTTAENSTEANTGVTTTSEEPAPPAKSDGYKIDGTISNVDVNTNLYLDFLTLTKIEAQDTALINADGSFSFEGKVKEKGIYRIRYNDRANWILLLDDGDELNTTLDAADIYGYTLTGSHDNVELVKFNDEMVATQQAMTDLNKLYYEYAGQGASGIQDAEAVKKELEDMSTDFTGFIMNYLDTTETQFMGIYCASFLNVDQNFDVLKGYVTGLEKELPNSVYTMEFKKRISDSEARMAQINAQKTATQKTSVGAVAPDITLPTPDGKTLTLSSLRGQVVLLDFWASWCGPCRQENPNVVKAYDKYNKKGFTVFNVSLDKDANKWKQAIAADGLKWDNHVSDLKGWQSSAARLYGVNSIPATYLLDKEGKIVAKNLRGIALEQKLAELLD